MTPAVSVVIPTFNRARYLRGAIASVLDQDHRDLELLVCDDGSSDGSLKFLAELARTDDRLRVIRNRGLRGPGGARNAGIAEARGEWVAFLDSDDRWTAGSLALRLAATRPGVVLVGGDCRIVDRETNRPTTARAFLLEHMVPWWERLPRALGVIDCAGLRAGTHALCDPRNMIGMTIGGYLWLMTSTSLVRRATLLAIGMFDARLARTEDLDLWLRLLREGAVAYVDHLLAEYDTTGRDTGTGPRYEAHGARRHDAYLKARFQLRFLQTLPGRVALDDAQRDFREERLAAARRRCGFLGRAGHPLAALGHYAAALATSREQRRLLRARPRGYFRTPD